MSMSTNETEVFALALHPLIDLFVFSYTEHRDFGHVTQVRAGHGRSARARLAHQPTPCSVAAPQAPAVRAGPVAGSTVCV